MTDDEAIAELVANLRDASTPPANGPPPLKPPNTRQYNAAEINLALSVVQISPCEDCGWPRVRGEYCPTCGSGK